tara:strand:- start:13590 stop:16262 length:2673 start_codon:yes stop_codon:yes gene_type:complete
MGVSVRSDFSRALGRELRRGSARGSEVRGIGARSVAALSFALLPLVVGCSGGGSGVAVIEYESTVSFTSNTSTSSEAGGDATVTVGLLTQLPSTTKAIDVEVYDLGSGSASAGVDYATFDPVTVTFPVGSITGDTVVLHFALLADTVAEGASETIRFGLRDASGAVIVGIQQSTVEIVDEDSASLSFTSAATVTPDESSSVYPVTVTLSLPAGATLGFDVDTLLVDDQTGNAEAGVDYVAIAPTPVQFPAGTANGAQQVVNVQVLDDSDYESSEFFAVHLTGAGLADLELSGPTRHVVNISDDESMPSPLMTATSGATGTETTHAGGGDTLQLGSANNDAGPNQGSILIVSNTGGLPMQLGQPLLIGADETDFKVEVEAASLTAAMQSNTSLAPPSDFVDLGAPFVRRSAQLSTMSGGVSPAAGEGLPGISVLLDEIALADLVDVDRVRFHGFPLPSGFGDVTLELERIPLPITSDAVLSVDGELVAGGPAALLSDLSTWRGRVLEIPGSFAFLALNSSVGPRGYVKLPFDQESTIHITSEASATASSPAVSRLIHEADLKTLPASDRAAICGGEILLPNASPVLDLAALGFDPDEGVQQQSPGASVAPQTSATVTVANCRLAIETDYQLRQKFGSNSELVDYVTSLIAAISDQYFEDAQTTLSIAYLGIHSDSDDGWTSPDGAGDAGDVLGEFRAAWTGANSWPVTADLAHFLSGASLGGGVAYRDVLCNQSYGFGVSGNLNGNINWSSWTGNAGSFTWDFVVVAHELGHNFGSTHTHGYCPALDSCSSGTCVSSTQCTQGTIMSYCHSCGGMDNIDLHFHPVVADLIRSKIESSCLGDATMPAGDEIRYRLRFDPRSGTGVKTTTLQFDHDAPNAPDPFTITLTGTSN